MHWEGWRKDKVVGAASWRVGEGAMTEAEQGASCEVRGSQDGRWPAGNKGPLGEAGSHLLHPKLLEIICAHGRQRGPLRRVGVTSGSEVRLGGQGT